MTIVYFVRHAEPNYKNHDDMSRELSDKGLIDRKLVTEFLADKGLMPWVVEFSFEKLKCVGIKQYNLFARNEYRIN